MSGERVAQGLTSLINGVSQQAQSFRLPSQCESLVNGWCSPLDGLSKRQPFRVMKKISPDIDWDNTLVHVINRDLSERYFVVVHDGDLRVFDLLNNGNEIPVTFTNGKTYLQCQDPSTQIRMVTVADYTFIVNTTKTVTMDPAEVLEQQTKEAIVFVSKGVIDTQYRVMINGTWVEYRTPDPSSTQTTTSEQTTDNATGHTEGSQTTVTENDNSQPSTEEIATSLRSLIQGMGGNVVDQMGSILRIRRSNGADFTFSISDSWGNQALVGVKGQVQKYENLPARCWDGTKVQVVGEDPTSDDDYYIEHVTQGDILTGVWKETRGWNQHNKFDNSTMPHTLIRMADGTFSFGPENWADRQVGDDNSVPYPTFVDRKISDIFFYRNRLGILVDENVVLTESGEYFNFWPSSAINVLDTDTIDIAVTNDTVSILRYAAILNDSLLLIADQCQFQLTSGSQAYLSPTTVQVSKTTEYVASTACRPVTSGTTLFFVTSRDQWDGIREYMVIDDYTTPEAPEITSHIPEYIPKGVIKMSTAINDGTTFLLTKADRRSLYVYKFYWVGQEKLQSSWSRWELPNTDAQILSMGVIDSTLYTLVMYNDGVYIEYTNLATLEEESDDLPFRVHLDRKVEVQGVYSSNTRETVWELPYSVATGDIQVLAGPGATTEPPGFRIYNAVLDGNYHIKAPGDHSQVPYIFGFTYNFEFWFSQFFVRESKTQGAPIFLGNRLQILDLTLSYFKSGYFKTHVIPYGRSEIVKIFNFILGSLTWQLNKPPVMTGKANTKVLSNSETVKIGISNDTIYPCIFNAAEWVGTLFRDEVRV